MKCDKIYIAIDLKSFYASVECKERNRDPLTTNLVVAGSEPYTKDDMSCSITGIKKIRNSGTAAAF